MPTLARYQRGLTLFNLLMGLGLFALLTSFAVPTLESTIKNRRKAIFTEDTIRLLNFARQESVALGVQVVMCPSANGVSCVSDWSNPLILFSDRNENERLDEEDILIRQTTLPYQTSSISWRSSLNRPYISFDPEGTTGYQNGRIYYCDESGDDNYRAQLIVYRTGRVRIAPRNELYEGCG